VQDKNTVDQHVLVTMLQCLVFMFQMFLELLDSDRRLCEAVACCLCKLTAALRVRVHYYSDPGIANLKQAVGVQHM
jgi:hypothetical protein